MANAKEDLTATKANLLFQSHELRTETNELKSIMDEVARLKKIQTTLVAMVEEITDTYQKKKGRRFSVLGLQQAENVAKEEKEVFGRSAI